ncbi:MAG: cation diffusion facilitator family transporter [Candidatus Aminicenantes bacterium]|nr:cation diffusion facilitator family transporter [Candidatus Aminicenantes bacterium]
MEKVVNEFLPAESPATLLRQKKGQTVVNLGLFCNIGLAALKTTMGIVGHSAALLSDGINSTSDVAYYIVVKIFMKLAGAPPDSEHPYGHRQMESIAALIVGSFVITTAIAIFWNSLSDVFDQLKGGADLNRASAATLWVALLTVALKIALTLYTSRVGKKTGNLAIRALAFDHRNDVFSALAASLGIFLSRRGHPWVDPLAGALVALLILGTGIEILRQSTADLMDSVPSHFLDKKIRSVLAKVGEIKRIEEIHAHRFGPYFVINLTIGIDGGQDVTSGDAIATRVEKLLTEKIELVRKVYVHYHPAS